MGNKCHAPGPRHVPCGPHARLGKAVWDRAGFPGTLGANAGWLPGLRTPYASRTWPFTGEHLARKGQVALFRSHHPRNPFPGKSHQGVDAAPSSEGRRAARTVTLRSARAPVAAQLRRIVVPAPPRSCSPCPSRYPLPAGFPLHVFFPICVKPTLEASRREPGPSCVTQTALKAAFALGEAGRPGMTRGQRVWNSRSDGRPTATAFPPRRPGPAFSRWRGRPF